MQINLRNFLMLKPFNESQDINSDDKKLNLARVFFILMPFVILASAMFLDHFKPNTNFILIILTLVAVFSLILSAVEWRLGLKAKALNKLFETLILTCLFLLLFLLK